MAILELANIAPLATELTLCPPASEPVQRCPTQGKVPASNNWLYFRGHVEVLFDVQVALNFLSG